MKPLSINVKSPSNVESNTNDVKLNEHHQAECSPGTSAQGRPLCETARVMKTNPEFRQGVLRHGLPALALALGLGTVFMPMRSNAALVFQNTLGSAAEIQNSLVGSGGTYLGQGSFVPGVFGNAFAANSSESYRVKFPKEVIPVQTGTIEFWGKLIDYSSGLPGNGGLAPTFFRMDNESQGNFSLTFSANDGLGGGGLVATAGKYYQAETGGFGSWTYDQALGAGSASDWHHYALVWGQNVSGTGHNVAAYVDGVLNSQRWYDFPSSSFGDLPSGASLGLLSNDKNQPGSVAIDNLKIWDIAKTDFSDRFVETTPVPEPSTVIAGALLLVPIGVRVIRALRSRNHAS